VVGVKQERRSHTDINTLDESNYLTEFKKGAFGSFFGYYQLNKNNKADR
jgi:hypothetical protein